MKIPKWSKRDLIVMRDKGYQVVPCSDEEDAMAVFTVLKENKRCAQLGYILDSENGAVYFVCTKKKAEKVVNCGQES